MNNVDRAKQFLAFDALSGLQQALREREIRHSRVEKVEISEDKGMEISNTLNKPTELYQQYQLCPPCECRAAGKLLPGFLYAGSFR